MNTNMKINIYALKKEQAMELEGFVLPGVLTRPESEKFWYFLAANDRKEPMGMIVISPYPEEADLISIGVSPAFSRQGVATELLSYTLEKIREAKIPGIRITYAQSSFAWEPLNRLLINNGFYMEEEMNTYSGTLKALSDHPQLKGEEDNSAIYSLAEISGAEKRKVELQIGKKNLFDPKILEECDEEISFIWKEDEMEAVFLLSYPKEGKLTNLYTWLGSNSPKKLLSIMKKSLSQAISYYHEDTEVIFTCMGKSSEKMVNYFLPGIKPVSLLRSYWHGALDKESYIIPKEETKFNENGTVEKEKPGEDRRAYWEDMKLQPADDSFLCCNKCYFRDKEDLMSCEKYLRKPGNIIYGGACPYFQEVI